jgi:DNA-directed RNA polymerase specialized sigma24 family protein
LAVSDLAEASAFEALLRILGPDRDSAGEKYEEFRQRLVRLFRLWGSEAPEDAADVTIARVTAKVAAGETIRSENPYAYFHGVARFVFMERLRARFRERAMAAEQAAPHLNAGEGGVLERRAACLEKCLGRLAPEDRASLLEYYDLSERARIDRRQAIADRLGITMTALRIRMHRERERLRPCVTACAGNEKAPADTSFRSTRP